MAECVNGCGNELRTYCFACEGRLRDDSRALSRVKTLLNQWEESTHDADGRKYLATIENMASKLRNAIEGR